MKAYEDLVKHQQLIVPLDLAVKYTCEVVKANGRSCGELRSNATITAEYVFLRQALELDLKVDSDALCHWFFSEQKPDGSWSIAPSDYPGDVSTTTEAYLALKILGISSDAPPMQRARNFVITQGGVEKVRIFTRIYLATFGLFPWNSVPALPAELIFMPAWAPINIYKLSSWARNTIVPLLMVCHHRPIFPLPNGQSAHNDYLDELWSSPTQKAVPYRKALRELLWIDLVAFAFAFMDMVLSYLDGLRGFFLREHALRQCSTWILEHQEASGDWAGIFPPMHVGLLALILEGRSLSDSCVVRGLEAVERFVWQDKRGKRVQFCVSPVWDTILMTIGLQDAGIDGSDEHLLKWVRKRQLLGPEGDWRIYNSQLRPGGFSFEYFNTRYPDVDDTAVAILAFVKQDPSSIGLPVLISAIEWILGMQNSDGGWAAFDLNNNSFFLNKIPFSDMDSLCDPSTADVTGRILEAFGLVFKHTKHGYINEALLNRMDTASRHGIEYLQSVQEPTGAWYGRWGSNYIYGTSNVLCGLEYYKHDRQVQTLIQPALRWLKDIQNADGGWGESLDTYKHPELAGCGSSTASQTGWGAMGLLAHLPPTDEVVCRSIAFLTGFQPDRKGEGASWPETEYTGTGFPRCFYLGYALYPHYFPMMAVGRFLRRYSSM
uniref:Terpene cyclase/mutase family member n=1 Tax=Cladonia uncialis subsp. uncialis TaxID=180999 RepID=A0A1Z1CCY7_CLAUC|nr:putative squalene cyclase [Cladonia uncialis subsp. uncialis]AUW31003.1 putative squalene-hopene cyclase [Cladonia uncialis subsp. uncialis]